MKNLIMMMFLYYFVVFYLQEIELRAPRLSRRCCVLFASERLWWRVCGDYL